MLNSSQPSTHLTRRMLVFMLVGALLGMALRQFETSQGWLAYEFALPLFEVIGQGFISLLKMLVVPLVFVSLICGISTLSDATNMGRLTAKTIALYLLTTVIAISLAMVMASVLQPGLSVEQSMTDVDVNIPAAPALYEVILGMIPTNPVQALADGNMLQIIIFAVLLGLAISQSGQAGQKIARGFTTINEVMLALVMLVMRCAPWGVLALMAKLTLTLGVSAFTSLANYFLVVVAVLLVQLLLVYPALLKMLSGLNPWIFLKKMRQAQLFAFGTSSSYATLPVTMQTLVDNLGVKRLLASFTLPLGSTINMDGTAIMQGVATVFIAQMYQIDLSMGQYVMIVVMATCASIGTAGVPSVGLITLAMVLQQVNVPVEGIAMIMAVDRLLDMLRTAVNISGDAMVTLLVAHSEAALDHQAYAKPVLQEPKIAVPLAEASSYPAG
jgi:Na+/H+-dicarboxylate symporter